jgi:hypothetical protein
VRDERSALLQHVNELIKTALCVEEPWQEDLRKRRRVANDLFREVLLDFRAIAHVFPQQLEITEESYGLQPLRSMFVRWKATLPERQLKVVLDTEFGNLSLAWGVGADQITTWYRLEEPLEHLSHTLISALADQPAWQCGNWPALPGEISFADPFSMRTSSSTPRRTRTSLPRNK